MFLFNGKLINEKAFDLDLGYKDDDKEKKETNPHVSAADLHSYEDKNIIDRPSEGTYKNNDHTFYDLCGWANYINKKDSGRKLDEETANSLAQTYILSLIDTDYLFKEGIIEVKKNMITLGISDDYTDGRTFSDFTEKFKKDNPKLKEEVTEKLNGNNIWSSILSKYNNKEEQLTFDFIIWLSDNLDLVPGNIGKESTIFDDYTEEEKKGNIKFSSIKKGEYSKDIMTLYAISKVVKSLENNESISNKIDLKSLISDTFDHSFVNGSTHKESDDEKDNNQSNYIDILKNEIKTHSKNPKISGDISNAIKEELPDLYNEYVKDTDNTDIRFDFIDYFLNSDEFSNVDNYEKETYDKIYKNYRDTNDGKNPEPTPIPSSEDIYRRNKEMYDKRTREGDVLSIPGVKLICEEDRFYFINEKTRNTIYKKDGWDYIKDDETKKIDVPSYLKSHIPTYFFCGTSLVIKEGDLYVMYEPGGNIIGKYKEVYQNKYANNITVIADNGDTDIINGLGKSIVPSDIAGNIDIIYDETEIGGNYVIPVKLKDGSEGYIKRSGEFIEGDLPKETDMNIDPDDVKLVKHGKLYSIDFKNTGRPAFRDRFIDASERNGVFVVAREEFEYDYINASNKSLTSEDGEPSFYYITPFNEENISLAFKYVVDENNSNTKIRSGVPEVYVYAFKTIGLGQITILDKIKVAHPVLNKKTDIPVLDSKSAFYALKIQMDISKDSKLGIICFDGNHFSEPIKDCIAISFDSMKVKTDDGKRYKLNADYTLGEEIETKRSSSEAKSKKTEESEAAAASRKEKTNKKEEKKKKSNEKLIEDSENSKKKK